MHKRFGHSMVVVLVGLAGCTAEPTGPARRASAPVLGKADATDQADRSCQVVLRHVGRDGSNGFQTRCTDGTCTWIWDGTIELADGLQPAAVRVLYHLAGDPNWWEVDATPAPDAQPGFQRYSFSFSEHLFGPDASEAELAAARIELMPYLELTDGTRLFDHNRVPGDFENYVMNQESYFGIPQAPATCAPVFARFTFFDSWDEHLTGILRQGGYLVLDYHNDRLPACRGQGWDITAHVRFTPGGQLVTGSVQGQPYGRLTVEIPPDATAAAVWFRGHDPTGCQTWDSNLSADYHHEVWPPADHPRCKDIERWATQHSDMPYTAQPHCLAHDIDQHANADSCELYLDGIGNGYMGHYGFPNNWIEAYIKVGPQQGTLLGAGLYTRYRDKGTGATGERFTLARQVAPDTWQSGFIYLRPGYMGAGGYDLLAEQLAFFIDVQRPSGEVVRLWQSRHGANYTWDDAFAGPTSTKYIPYGNIQYATGAATVFDAKNACTP